MKSKHTVRVLKRHIEAGEPATCDRCPIALALNEATGLHWEVGEYKAIAKELSCYFDVPVEARFFVEDFDRGETVEPFSFEMPEPY